MSVLDQSGDDRLNDGVRANQTLNTEWSRWRSNRNDATIPPYANINLDPSEQGGGSNQPILRSNQIPLSYEGGVRCYRMALYKKVLAAYGREGTPLFTEDGVELRGHAREQRLLMWNKALVDDIMLKRFNDANSAKVNFVVRFFELTDPDFPKKIAVEEKAFRQHPPEPEKSIFDFLTKPRKWWWRKGE